MPAHLQVETVLVGGRSAPDLLVQAGGLVAGWRSDWTPLDPVARLPIFNDIAVYGRMFHHIRIIDLIHRRHAPAGVARAEIALEQIELLGGRPRAADRRD